MWTAVGLPAVWKRGQAWGWVVWRTRTHHAGVWVLTSIKSDKLLQSPRTVCNSTALAPSTGARSLFCPVYTSTNQVLCMPIQLETLRVSSFVEVIFFFSCLANAIFYRVGHKKPSPILFCLKCYCICLYGQDDTPYKLLVCSAHIDVKT